MDTQFMQPDSSTGRKVNLWRRNGGRTAGRAREVIGSSGGVGAVWRNTIVTDYWSDKTVFAHVGKLEVASVMFEVTADFSKALPHAFSLKVTLRGLGVQLGSTTVSPIADKPVSISIIQPIGGTLQGKITDWGATDSKGNPVPAHDTAWSDAAMVSFLITGTGNVALPVGDLLELVPGLGFLLKAAVSALGSTVSVNLGHKAVGLPIHRDASGKPIQPT